MEPASVFYVPARSLWCASLTHLQVHTYMGHTVWWLQGMEIWRWWAEAGGISCQLFQHSADMLLNLHGIMWPQKPMHDEDPEGGGWVRKRNKASTQYNSLCSPTFNLKELGERNCLSFKDILNIKLHIKRQVPKLRPCLDFKRNEKSVTIFWSALCQNWSPPNIYGATHHQPNAVYYTLCCSC